MEPEFASEDFLYLALWVVVVDSLSSQLQRTLWISSSKLLRD